MRGFFVLGIAALVVLLGACTQGAVKPNAVSYALAELNDSGVSGTVTFEKLTDRHAAVVIEVDGLATGSYPAHIHTGDHPGPVYIPLEDVHGSSGTSVTVIGIADTGGESPYEHLVNFDGHVNVHDGATIVASGETGAGGDDVQVNP